MAKTWLCDTDDLEHNDLELQGIGSDPDSECCSDGDESATESEDFEGYASDDFY